MQYKFANRMNGVKSSAIKELLKNGADPEVINFGGGYPDPELFPLDALQKVYEYTINHDGRKAFQYAQTDGLLSLRNKVVERMKIKGVQCELDNVLIVHGGQQGIHLIAKMLLDEGDSVLCESPSYLGALQSFDSFLAKNIGVSMDENGMRMDALELALQNNPDTKFIYTIPDFQNPTGVTMSLERRKKIVELAEQYDVLIVEDNPYGEIRYEGTALPAIKSFDRYGRVIHIGSYSKILCPGMRLGWIIAEPELTEKICHLKMTADVQNSTVNMYAVNNFIDMFDLDEHIGTLKAAYREKKNLMIQTMKETFPHSVSFTNPEGGLFTWLTFPENIDSKVVMSRALTEAKIAFVPGEPFFASKVEKNHCRISYSAMSKEKIVEGITKLGKILYDMGL